MQVTSMMSAGYLQPSRGLRSLEEELARRKAQTEGVASAAPTGPAQEEGNLAAQEKDILNQEKALRAKLGTGVEVHTIYHYTLGLDGRRYISGASVTMKGEEDDLNRVSGGITTKDIQAREDEEARKVAATEDKAGSRKSDDAAKHSSGGADPELSEEEKAQVRELQQIQREVIAHEAAHQAAAGQFGGGVSYSYTQGPDGKSYITGGEVPIQIKRGSTPEETLRNMQQVQRAAMAPADPSGQDRQVAAQAAAIAAQARSEAASGAKESQDGGRAAEVARGAPVQRGRQEEEDPSKKGVSSLLASLRAAEIQNQIQIQTRLAA